jgi:hypothetical protein
MKPHDIKCMTFAALAAATIGLSASQPSGARAQEPTQVCPAGYSSLVEFNLCIHPDVGDVVQAASPERTGALPARVCPSGYWRTREPCISSATGDVEEAK